MQSRLINLLYGMGLTAGALAIAWLINVVFQRSWTAIALFLLAMLIVILLQRMVAGGIPEEQTSRVHADQTSHAARPSIREETAHLAGADLRYGWMATPPMLTLVAIVAFQLL